MISDTAIVILINQIAGVVFSCLRIPWRKRGKNLFKKNRNNGFTFNTTFSLDLSVSLALSLLFQSQTAVGGLKDVALREEEYIIGDSTGELTSLLITARPDHAE